MGHASTMLFKWAGTFFFQDSNSGPRGRRLIGKYHLRVYPSFHPLSVLAKNRFAALIVRVGER